MGSARRRRPGERPGAVRFADAVVDEPAVRAAPELAIDTDVARRVIGEFIRGQLRQAGFERAVLGLSGGIDSALVAYLVAEAIGAANGCCASRCPYRDVVARVAGRRGGGRGAASAARTGWSRSRRWSTATSARPAPDGPTASALRRGNFMARARMVVLYDQSVTWGGLVVGTGNKTEALIGYTTQFGDNASAFNPIGDLYKSQVRQLAVAIGVPDAIVRKAPVGRPVARPDRRDRGRLLATPSSTACCSGWIDRRRSIDELVAMGFDAATVERVDRMVAGVRVQAPGAADRQARAADAGHRLPLSAAAAGLARAPVTPDGRGAGAGRDACTSSRRPSATSATSRSGRSRCCGPLPLDRGRGHAHDARGCWARYEIDDADDQLPRPQSGAARATELLGAARARARTWRSSPTPARRSISDPGGELVAPGRREGGTVVPIPGASAVLAALVGDGIAGPALVVRGVPAALRAGATGAAGARSRPTSAARVLFEAPGRLAATLRDLAAACGAERARRPSAAS